ncbi:uncharacterized protein [Nicotiana sylvestris]|uniref:uncharacterized protein n=1 Tax=Nicotiana sylvestris TaxID=4096 RepID=UPI00388C4955
MVKRPMKKNQFRRLKKEKVEMHHLTLDDFLPSWFRLKISHDGIEASCCNADKGVNRILVDEGSSVNIFPIRTVKELGIPMNELSESRVMIQGFNQGGKRAISVIKMEITIEDMQSSAWIHVIDAKTSYNVLLGMPWIHENKFYLKDRIVKELKVDDGMKSKNDESTTKRAEVTTGEAKAITEEVQPNANKSYRGNIASYGKKDLWPKIICRLPTKRTDEGFDPNAYRLFAKSAYNPNESSKLGKLPSEAATRQPRESFGYKQPSPVCISIRRASSNYIIIEDESFASNKPSIFDRLGKSHVRTSVFEKLGPLKKGNKFQRIFQSIRIPASPKIQKISKDFQSLVPSRMRRQTKLMVLCKEVLEVKPYTVVYTNERDEDEESVGSSYHVTVQGENGVPSSMEDNAELEDVSPCYHIYFNDGEPQEDEDAKDALPELEEGVKTTVDGLKEVNLSTDEEPRPTYLSVLPEVDEESTYIELLKEFRDVFAWSYKEMPGLDPKVAVHYLEVKNGARPVKQAQRRFRLDLVPLIESEVNKLIEAGFIREVKYPTWVSSIVPIRKKNGQIRVYVDFRDFNNACPKDELPLPITELIIDATIGYEAMSFMDGSSGYNQIRMAPKDEELIAFRTPRVFIATSTSNAFESIKSYLMKPPVLAAPILGKALILYILAQERSVGVLSAQENSEGKENSLYYLSRMMTPNELNYSPIEKLCLALVSSIQKLKHYFQDHVVHLAIKGQALADFLVDHPIPDDWELTDELPDEDAMVIEVQPPWKMYSDGAAHRGEAGAGVVFVTSQGGVLPYSFMLMQLCYNNIVEYQALILALKMAVKMKWLQLQVFGDSQLVVNQLLGSYEVKKPELRPYHDYTKKLIGWLGDVTIHQVPRKGNKKADALAALASSLTLPDQAQVTVCQK